MQTFLEEDLKNTEQPIGFILCSSLKQHSIYRLLKNTVFTRPLLKLLLVSVCEKEHSIYMWKSMWNVFPSQRSKQGTSKTSRGRCASIFVGKAVSNWLWPKMHLQMCVEVTNHLSTCYLLWWSPWETGQSSPTTLALSLGAACFGKEHGKVQRLQGFSPQEPNVLMRPHPVTTFLNATFFRLRREPRTIVYWKD